MTSSVRRSEAVLLSWSGGKDSALALSRLRDDAGVRVVGLLTTVTADYDRISIHGVRRSLLRTQAEQLGLPLCEIVIEPRTTNHGYEAAWAAALRRLPAPLADARRIAFGDIFLEDVRAYREQLMTLHGFSSVFPLWGERTDDLARKVLAAGIVARIVCVDTEVLSSDFAGRMYDEGLLRSLPEGIDPCGERGEFHTFVSGGPGFSAEVPYRLGDVVIRESRFAYCDLIPTTADLQLVAPAVPPQQRDGRA